MKEVHSAVSGATHNWVLDLHLASKLVNLFCLLELCYSILSTFIAFLFFSLSLPFSSPKTKRDDENKLPYHIEKQLLRSRNSRLFEQNKSKQTSILIHVFCKENGTRKRVQDLFFFFLF